MGSIQATTLAVFIDTFQQMIQQNSWQYEPLFLLYDKKCPFWFDVCQMFKEIIFHVLPG